MLNYSRLEILVSETRQSQRSSSRIYGKSKKISEIKSRNLSKIFLGIPELLQMEEPTRRIYSYLNHCSKITSSRFLNIIFP